MFTYHARLDGLSADSAIATALPPTTIASEGAVHGVVSHGCARPGGVPLDQLRRSRHPESSWTLSSPQSRHAVEAVERFQPLFHLLNGDLCYANINPRAQPAVWADFGNNVQRSAANRPWMPCPGNHEIEFYNGAQGLIAYLTRYSLPDNGTQFPGRWYQFSVGSVLFISLAADDVIYQDSGAFVAGPEPLSPAPSTGNAPIEPGTSLYVRGYSQGAQTRWLERRWRPRRRTPISIGSSCRCTRTHSALPGDGNGCDKGIRETWLPLFDRYGVDLVLCGHDHDYERSWPVRGCNRHVGRDAVTGARWTPVNRSP